MPLKLASFQQKDATTLNRWADDIEWQLSQNKHQAAIAVQTASSPPPTVVDISLDMPPEFHVAGSPANATGDFKVTWNPEPSGTVLAGPYASGVSQYVDAISSFAQAGSSITASAIASQNDIAVLVFQGGDAHATTPAVVPPGWTTIVPTGNNQFVAGKLVPPSTVSATPSYTAGTTPCVGYALMLFPAGTLTTLPTFTTIGSFGGSISSSAPTTISGTVPQNSQFMMVIVTSGQAAGNDQNNGVATLSDTLGNTFVELVDVSYTTQLTMNDASFIQVWITNTPIKGSDTFTFTVLPPPLGGTTLMPATTITVLSLSNAIPKSAAVPSFKPLSSLLAAGGASYQTVEQAGTAKTQRANLNFLAPVTAADNLSNNSTDITVPNMVGDSGSGGTAGLVPAPPSGSGSSKFLRADGTWVAAGGGPWFQTSAIQQYFQGYGGPTKIYGPDTTSTLGTINTQSVNA